MKKVITYGTYDLLHNGHIRLLERAKALGDYLIVGVTSEDFDKRRGKINVQQSLMERIQAVKNTGLADEIIVEEYEGQKIDDIIKYGIDIFTLGSDWEGKFDYLKEYCDVIYLPRTEGISSSLLRSDNSKIRLGLVGNFEHLIKIYNDAQFVNGLNIAGICSDNYDNSFDFKTELITSDYEELIKSVDAVFIYSNPKLHYKEIKYALMSGKHVLCESPICDNVEKYNELVEIAKKNNCILMDSIKPAYCTAYNRLLLLLKSGIIGKIVSIDSTCTSLKDNFDVSNNKIASDWSSMSSWGPTAMLPIFQLFGVNYINKNIYSLFVNRKEKIDGFTKIDFLFKSSVASIKVGKSVKSEGELIISGTKGYAFVPAPWWKTDYFEIRYEDIRNNKRYFYSFDGDGFRYVLLDFIKAIKSGNSYRYISYDVSKEICNVLNDFNKKHIELEN